MDMVMATCVSRTMKEVMQLKSSRIFFLRVFNIPAFVPSRSVGLDILGTVAPTILDFDAKSFPRWLNELESPEHPWIPFPPHSP